MSITRSACIGLLATFATVTIAAAPAFAQQQKPNILVIMGDDIGYWNISAYNRGMMGYRTPNIDRIANEGAIFTDYYGQYSRLLAARSESYYRWFHRRPISNPLRAERADELLLLPKSRFLTPNVDSVHFVGAVPLNVLHSQPSVQVSVTPGTAVGARSGTASPRAC